MRSYIRSIVALRSIQVTADHGPAVSGAHNTIVTARAGKDLVSALCSGLLTIGPRFGGALDKAAEMFTQVCIVCCAGGGVNSKRVPTSCRLMVE